MESARARSPRVRARTATLAALQVTLIGQTGCRVSASVANPFEIGGGKTHPSRCSWSIPPEGDPDFGPDGIPATRTTPSTS